MYLSISTYMYVCVCIYIHTMHMSHTHSHMQRGGERRENEQVSRDDRPKAVNRKAEKQIF